MRVATYAALIAAGGFLLAWAGSAGAATYTFVPGASESTKGNTANWTDGSSWVNTASPFATGTVPGPADVAGSSTGGTAVIDSAVPTINDLRWANAVAGGTVTPQGGSAVTYTGTATLNIITGGALTIASANGTSNGNALFGRAQPSTATFNMTGGTLVTTSTVAITNDAPATLSVGDISNATAGGTANFTLGGGTITLGNNYVVGTTNTSNGSGGFNRGTGNVTQAGGSIAAAGAVIIGNGGQATYVMSGGSINQNGTNPDGSPLGRDAFFVSRNANSIGSFEQSGTAAVSIANGLFIANNSNTNGTYTISGGTLTIAGEMKVAASTNSTGTTAVTGNVGAFIIIGNAAPTITVNRLTADTANSTLGFAVGSAAGTTLLNVAAGNTFAGNAVLAAATRIDLDPSGGFTPTAGQTFELIRAVSINSVPTLVADGDAFDAYALTIRPNGDGTQSLVAAVPEPAGLAVLAGVFALALPRRRGGCRR